MAGKMNADHTGEIDWTAHSREQRELYEYYRSLGYDDRIATVLALYTFGKRGRRGVTIDEIYEELIERSRPDNMYGRAESVGIGTGRTGRSRKSRYESTKAPREASSHAARASNKAFTFEPMEESAFDASFSGSLADSAPAFLNFGQSAPSAKLSAPCMHLAMPATDEYEPIEERDFRSVTDHLTSTFRMTTNTASAGVVLNQLRDDRRIDRSMVRIEEMLNYFRYKSIRPETEKFRISGELMPVTAGRKLLYINVQGKEEVKDRQNIVLLLDVSGSMSGNTVQVQAMVATIISKLDPGDKISLVTYSSHDEVVFRGYTIRDGKDRTKALEKFLGVTVSGCTYGSAGIETAYEIGKAEYIEGGNSQVILITDGDLNFGVTDKGGLAELIEEKKKSDLFLSVIGTGLYNYKDDKLETLCKHGNGVYRTVNNLADVKKCINAEYASLVNVIAKDVKAQVEFNPEVVESFRLLGFENREIAHEDFVNDKVISEPFGSGGYGVALYELVLRDGDKPVESGYRYAKVVTTGSSELGTVKVRYKEPLEDTSKEIEYVISSAEDGFTDNLRLAYVVYVCAEKLRGSDKISRQDIELAGKLCGEIGEEIREMNKADFYKLPEILKRTGDELNVGIHSKDRFEW